MHLMTEVSHRTQEPSDVLGNYLTFTLELISDIQISLGSSCLSHPWLLYPSDLVAEGLTSCDQSSQQRMYSGSARAYWYPRAGILGPDIYSPPFALELFVFLVLFCIVLCFFFSLFTKNQSTGKAN